MGNNIFDRLSRQWKKQVGRLKSLPLREQLILSGLLVGTASGVSAWAFHEAIDFTVRFAAFLQDALPRPFSAAATLFLPALGGLVAGLLTHRYCREAKGAGVHNVVTAIRDRNGHIEGRVSWVTTIASAATIGSGGSAGSEGPIVQIGAAVGSWIARTLDVTPENLRMLVAGGAAGGLAASFNIPLAGVFFVMEVILNDFANQAFSAVVISSVTSSVVAGGLLGRESYFMHVDYEWRNAYEFALYALMGLLCAPLGVWYEETLNYFEDAFSRLTSLPDWIRPGLGGLLVGAIALAVPEVLGTGRGTINGVLQGQILGWMAFAIIGAKILATGLTLGSGGAGGALMPSLYIGAVSGAALGQLLRFVPGFPFQQGALALVGMSCVFTAAFNAPITAIIMALEISRDYGIVMPVMFACVIAYLSASRRRRTHPPQHGPTPPPGGSSLATSAPG